MSSKKLKLDIFSMCLRFTVDTKSDNHIYSPKFHFRGGRWILNYFKCGTENCILLLKCSGVSPNPLHVSVHVESSVNGRITSVLPWETRFTDEFKENDTGEYIWREEEEKIPLSVSEFRLYGILKLVVVLSVDDSVAIQTEQSHAINELSCLENLSLDLAQLMTQDSNPDVEFKCADESTMAHKLIVRSRSPVLAAMLSTDMVEGRTGVVRIPNMAPEVFGHLLKYIYTGTLDELAFDVALSLYEAGDQYAVRGLARRCSRFLLEQLTVDNACDVLMVADSHSDDVFKGAIVRFMVDKKVPKTYGRWQEFCGSHPMLAVEVLNRYCNVANGEEETGTKEEAEEEAESVGESEESESEVETEEAE